VAVTIALAAACSEPSDDAGEFTTTVLDVEVRDEVDTAGAEVVCEEYVQREVPGGTLLLVIPQSVAEARQTDPEAWPDRSPADQVVACSFSVPGAPTSTVCPDGSIVEPLEQGAIGSASVDLDGVVGSESPAEPLDLCVDDSP
jgi:hypothetical protein